MVLREGPDEGWAWVIAFAACIINMILSGISRMIGILYVAVIDEYGVSRQEATMPFSIRNSIRCLSGPLVGIVGQKFSIKSITLFGGVLASLGAICCAFAPNVTWITVFWGGIHGLGFAFANTLFQVVVNQYFEKYRATASGIALSGACLGALAFPFMIEGLLDTYRLSGSFLILGGIVMNVLPPAILLQSPSWVRRGPKSEKTEMKSTAPDGSIVTVEHSPPILKIEKLATESSECRIFRSTSLNNCPVDGVEIRSTLKSSSPGSQSPEYNGNVNPIVTQLTSVEEVHDETPQIKEYSSNVLVSASIAESKDHKKEYSPTTEKKKTVLRIILNLYTNPVYLLISVGMATYVVIFIPVLTVIVDYSKDKGISESNGKYLINAMALGDLIGRLGFGWVTDRGYMTIPRFFTTTLVFQALFISLFPFAMSLATIMILLVLYGIMAGSMLILFPILVLKYVASDEQAIAMGSVGFLSGMATLVLPLLIGHFRDNMGSYDGLFYFIGGVSLLCGALWFLEPILAKYSTNYEKPPC